MSITKNKNINFVRYGHLSQKKGKGINGSGFHKAPANIGLYAFPEFFVEYFLVNWKYDNKVAKYHYDILNIFNKKYKTSYDSPNDFFNNCSSDDLTEWDKIESTFYKKIRNKEFKIIKYRGKVWHHFVNESKSPIRNNCWALDTYEDYVKCLYKYIHTTSKSIFDKKCCIHSDVPIKQNIINIVKSTFSKDMFEVYLPEKIK